MLSELRERERKTDAAEGRAECMRNSGRIGAENTSKSCGEKTGSGGRRAPAPINHPRTPTRTGSPFFPAARVGERGLRGRIERSSDQVGTVGEDLAKRAVAGKLRTSDNRSPAAATVRRVTGLWRSVIADRVGFPRRVRTSPQDLAATIRISRGIWGADSIERSFGTYYDDPAS